jgi:hypothetical protein
MSWYNYAECINLKEYDAMFDPQKVPELSFFLLQKNQEYWHFVTKK